MSNIPLYRQIINDISGEILNGNLRPGDRVGSESELAAKYMVSNITSKNALIDLADKGFIIRQKGKGSFVNSMEQLMTIPSFYNTNSSRSEFKSKTIALILPSMKTGIDQQLLNSIESIISKTEYLLTLTITRESQIKEAKAIEKFKKQGVHGIIIFPTEHELYNESILKLSIEKFPFVLVDRCLKGINTNTVTIDNFNITKKATDYLFSKGHQNLAFISPNSKNTVTDERLSGFNSSLLENNISLNPFNTCLIPTTLSENNEKQQFIENYLKNTPKITGIICSNKEMATYIVSILDKENLWYKYDVCAFDYNLNNKVSYIEQDVTKISEMCIILLLNAIQGSTSPEQICIPAKFYPV